jgi:spore maturation protein CgeB
MKIVMFYHSLVSCWNHGNAHFLRGVVAELLARGHDVRVYEPRDGWSIQNLRTSFGEAPIRDFHRAFPTLRSIPYDPADFALDAALQDADLVLVHEWNDHDLVRQIGQHRARRGRYRLLFHDTHHRAVTQPASIKAFDLSNYDGALAFGEVLRKLYLSRGWAKRAWTWHEAADVRVFKPIERDGEREGDLIWIGNWGDDERTAELHEFLIDPIRSLGLRARFHGARYPEDARRTLAGAGIEYGDWLPNYRAPVEFAKFAATVHVPRRPYVKALPGIPTIRVFEALACGIPLICSPWPDVEHLFSPGRDFLVARDGAQMKRHLRAVLHDPDFASELAEHGRRTIRDRHTCAHRVDELMKIIAELSATKSRSTRTPARRAAPRPAGLRTRVVRT